MGLSRRELIVTGALLAVLTLLLVYQWWFNPNTCWWRAEARQYALRRAEHQYKTAHSWGTSLGGYEAGLRLESEARKRGNVILSDVSEAARIQSLAELTRSALTAYESFARRFPEHPKAVAAWVMMADLEETLDWHSPRIVERRARVAEFYDDESAVEAVWHVNGLDHAHISMEAAAYLEPLRFAPLLTADTLKQGWDRYGSLSLGLGPTRLWNSKSGVNVPLPIPERQQVIDSTATWKREAGKVAFATVLTRIVGDKFIYYGARWTVRVADYKVGKLRAFLPSQPQPDMREPKLPSLIWSSDGKRLTCGSETFVVE